MQKARMIHRQKWALQDAMNALNGVLYGYQPTPRLIISTMNRDRPGGHEGTYIEGAAWAMQNTPKGRKHMKKMSRKAQRKEAKKITAEALREMNIEQEDLIQEQFDWEIEQDDYAYLDDPWYGFEDISGYAHGIDEYPDQEVDDYLHYEDYSWSSYVDYDPSYDYEFGFTERDHDLNNILCDYKAGDISRMSARNKIKELFK